MGKIAKGVNQIYFTMLYGNYCYIFFKNSLRVLEEKILVKKKDFLLISVYMNVQNFRHIFFTLYIWNFLRSTKRSRILCNIRRHPVHKLLYIDCMVYVVIHIARAKRNYLCSFALWGEWPGLWSVIPYISYKLQ